MTRFLTSTLFFILVATSGVLANCAAPTGLQSLNNSDGVLLSWNAVPGAISYWLKVENANNNPQMYEIEIPVNATSYLVTNLNANASYKFKVRTKCSDDKSDWTDYISFQTATAGGGTGGGGGNNGGGGTGGACDIPTGLTVSNLTSNSAILSWSPVAGALRYEVEVEDDENTPLFSFNALTTDTTIAVIGLVAGGNYQFKVKSKCAGDVSSAYSASVLFGANATGGGTPGGGTTGGTCATPANLQVSEITTTSVKLSWSPVAGALRYEVEVEDDENTPAFSFDALTANTEVLIIGLTPGGHYQFKVKSKCGGGQSSEYAAWTFFSTATQLTSPAAGSAGVALQNTVNAMSAFRVFPNPAASEVSIQWNEPTTDLLSLAIVNAQGRQLMRYNNIDGSNGQIELPVSNLDAGLYVVVVSNGKTTKSQQLLIVK